MDDPSATNATAQAAHSAEGESGASELESFTVSRTRVVLAPRAAISPPPMSSLRAVVDPGTRSWISEPAGIPSSPVALSGRLEWQLSTSHEGLREVRLPSGGVMIHLEGRFLTSLHGKVGVDGAATVTHGAPAPGTSAECEEDR